MPIRYSWLIQQQVLLVEMRGAITVAEFRKWAVDINPFYGQTPHPYLHLVIDATHLARIPPFRTMLDIPLDAKRGWVIIFGLADKPLQFVASMIVQLTRTEVKFVAGLDEAFEMLRRVDQSVQGKPTNIPDAWVEVGTTETE